MRLLLIDDDPFARTVLTATITALGHEVVGTAATAPEALAKAQLLQPDIAVVDLDLGEGPTGIDVARGLRKMLPSIAILMLSTYTDPRLIGHNQASLPPGAQYLTKASVSDVTVLQDALEVAALSWDAPGAQAPSDINSESVTPRLSDLQIDLLRLIAAGHSNAEIADRKHITVQSVEKAVNRLIKDLGIQVGKSQNPRVTIAQTYFRLAGAVSDRQD
jgi:two-component system nitrate/nitrite response regulator NarL